MYDIFVSYAREDETVAKAYAERLTSSKFVVFYAPQTLRAKSQNLHAELLEALRNSRNVLLLWSASARHSQWVALEMSIYATLRLADGPSSGGAIALDRGGPRMPDWFPCDLLLSRGADKCLEELLQRREWRAENRAGSGPCKGTRAGILNRLSTLGGYILFDLAGWFRHCRTVLPRLGPNFAVAEVRPDERRSAKVETLVGDSILLMISAFILLLGISWVLAAFVFSGTYVPDWAGYVRREILLTNAIALAAGIIICIRIGIAAALSATLLGGICGTAAALIMGWIGRPGPVAGGITAGVALGGSAATSYVLARLTDQQSGFRTDLNGRPLVGLIFAIGLVAGIQTLSEGFASKAGNPTAVGKATFGLVIGGIVFVVVAAVSGWVAYREQRGYFWRSAARFGFWVWIALALATAVTSAAVPFGNPFTLADGLGVGLLAGAALGGSLSVVQHFTEPVVGQVWATPASAAGLAIIALPLLRRFEHIHADAVYGWLAGSAAVTFAALLIGHRARHGLSDQSKGDVPEDVGPGGS